MKIAITGANGFLGKALTKKLRSKKISYTPLNSKKHDLFNPDTLKSLVSGKDVIIHLAAVNRGENKDLVETNVLGTLSILEAASKYAPNAKIIFSSSFQVYLDEGLYGISKKTAEDLIIQYTKKTNLKGVILRISNIYGPDGKPFYNSVIATFAHLVKKGGPIKVQGDGSSKRDFIFVEDVADAVVKAALYKSKEPFEIIDICYGKEATLNEILKILKKVSGKNFEVVYNTDTKDKPWPTSGKNFRRAKRLLNWKPSTSLERGLKTVITL